MVMRRERVGFSQYWYEKYIIFSDWGRALFLSGRHSLINSIVCPAHWIRTILAVDACVQ